MDLVAAYEVLGVAAGADEAEVRDAHRDMVDAWTSSLDSDNVDVARQAASEITDLNNAFEAISTAGFPSSVEAEPEVGHYVDIATMLMPDFVRIGHGFLVLRDLDVDRLTIDGVFIPRPDAPAPPFTGSFRGYFNVPPGAHTLIAQKRERTSTWTCDLAPNEVEVQRIDWNEGGWCEPSADGFAQFRELARSGQMLQQGALRPWPLASIYLLGAADNVWIDRKHVSNGAPFLGITNLTPGKHLVQVGPTCSIELELRPTAMQLVDVSAGRAQLLDATMGNLMVRTMMMKAPANTLVSLR